MPERMRFYPKGRRTEDAIKRIIREILAKERSGGEYNAQAWEDARDTVRNFQDEIIEELVEPGGQASDDLMNDYGTGDSYHHESHVDKEYRLLEAAQLLDELSEYEETDSGLWEGQDPRAAVSTQAAYTYGNAVYDKWRDLIKEINEAVDELTEVEET